MRLTLRICILPLLVGLTGSMIACSEGSTTPAGNGDEGGADTGTGGKSATTTTDAGGTTNTTTAATGGTAPTTTWTKCFDFAMSTEGWKKNFAHVPDATDKTVTDATASAALLADTSADWMDLPGYGGTNGFVQLTIPYKTTQSDYQQLLYSYIPATGLDLTGKTLHAFVKLTSGMTADDPSKPSGAKMVIKTGADWYYADGGWVNMSKNEWIEIMLTVNSPSGVDMSKDASLFDPTDVREISVSFDTSGAATTIGSPGIIALDKVCY
jgi:hypothetical protein